MKMVVKTLALGAHQGGRFATNHLEELLLRHLFVVIGRHVVVVGGTPFVHVRAPVSIGEPRYPRGGEYHTSILDDSFSSGH